MPKNIPLRLKTAMLFSPRLGRSIGNLELSEALGITPSRLSQIRSGAPLSVAQLVKACDYLGVHYEWMLTGQGRMDRSGMQDERSNSAYAHFRRDRGLAVPSGFVEAAIEHIADSGIA